MTQDEPEDDFEDRPLLGGGFRTFIDCLAENAQVLLDEVVKEVIQEEASVAWLHLADTDAMQVRCRMAIQSLLTM